MFKRILVPIDGGKLSDRAIQASLELAQQMGAAIVGFVVVPRSSPAMRLVVQRDDEDDFDESKTGAARAALAGFEQAAQAAGVAFQGVCHPARRIDRAIIEAAEAQDCDMIFMVTHGRGPFGEFLYGSQTKAVLAGSKLPLMILK